MNKVILLGRLTREPDLRYASGADAKAVCSFGIAVDRQYKRHGQPYVDFIECTAFGKTGEFVSEYFGKGKLIAICGELRIESYKTKTGENRTAAKVYINDVYFAGNSVSGKSGDNKKESAPTDAFDITQTELQEVEPDEDLPF